MINTEISAEFRSVPQITESFDKKIDIWKSLLYRDFIKVFSIDLKSA